MTAHELQKPEPITDALSEEWFEAAREGRFLIQKRKHDGGYQWYPRTHALGTLDTDVEWVEASGRGTLHTYTVVHRTPNAEFAEDCPYVLAIVELEEGPRVSTRIIDTPLEALACDVPVTLRFQGSGGYPMPYFVVSGASE